MIVTVHLSRTVSAIQRFIGRNRTFSHPSSIWEVMMIMCDVIYRWLCILLGLSFGLILGHVILRPRLQIFSLVLGFSSDVEISADPQKTFVLTQCVLPIKPHVERLTRLLTCIETLVRSIVAKLLGKVILNSAIHDTRYGRKSKKIAIGLLITKWSIIMTIGLRVNRHIVLICV